MYYISITIINTEKMDKREYDFYRYRSIPLFCHKKMKLNGYTKSLPASYEYLGKRPFGLYL